MNHKNPIPAPIIAAADGWAPAVPGAIVAAGQGRTRPEEVTTAVTVLERHGHRVLGTVLVRPARVLRSRRASSGAARGRPRAGDGTASRLPA